MSQARVLFIDHDDSFSNNITSALEARGVRVDAIQSRALPDRASKGLETAEELSARWDAVVFSPGPGHPREYPASLALFERIPTGMPVLGVCLGLQIALWTAGAQVGERSAQPIHGRQIGVKSACSRVLSPLAYEGTFVLYNSLGVAVDDPALQSDWDVLCAHEGMVLVAEHRVLPRVLLQFHPESFASAGGPAVLDHFVQSVHMAFMARTR